MSDGVASSGAPNSGPTYRVPRGGMDPATKRLALIAAALGGTLFVVFGAWSTLGGSHGGGAVPVIDAPAGPVRVKPANPGGLKIAQDQILGGGLNDAAGDKLAPEPESPDPQALKPPPPPAPPAPKPVALAAPPPVAPMPPVAQTAPAPVITTAAPANALAVQLASLPTREAAEAEWHLLAHRNPLLASRTPSFSEATVNGRVWWRVRTGGFGTDAEARAFCDKLRAAGGACSVARF